MPRRLGLRELSVAPGEMLEVKSAIRETTVADATPLATETLEAVSVDEVEVLFERHRTAQRV